jgi:hypothetical protein
MALSILVALSACATDTEFQLAARNLDKRVAEKTICPGMSASEVKRVMGEPTYESADADHCESWTYDACARDIEIEEDGRYRILAYTQFEVSRPCRRKITVIVKFDDVERVAEISHISRVFDYPVD